MADRQRSAEVVGNRPRHFFPLIELLLDPGLQAVGVGRYLSSWLMLVVRDDLSGVAYNLVHDGLHIAQRPSSRADLSEPNDLMRMKARQLRQRRTVEPLKDGHRD